MTALVTSFSTDLGLDEVAGRLAAVIASDTLVARLGGRTSEVPFVGSVGKATFAFRRPGRNSFKPLFLGHIRGSDRSTTITLEARNVFAPRSPAVGFVTVAAIFLVGLSALAAGDPLSALGAAVLGALLLGGLYALVGRWQGAEIKRTFGLIERVVGARTVEEARSIGLTVQ